MCLFPANVKCIYCAFYNIVYNTFYYYMETSEQQINLPECEENLWDQEKKENDISRTPVQNWCKLINQTDIRLPLQTKSTSVD